jgi:hypothetical protein
MPSFSQKRKAWLRFLAELVLPPGASEVADWAAPIWSMRELLSIGRKCLMLPD